MLESGLLLAHFPLLYKGADEVQLMIAVLSSLVRTLIVLLRPADSCLVNWTT